MYSEPGKPQAPPTGSKASSNALFCASQATQSFAIAVLLYEGFAYNWIFLCRILPAVGKSGLIVFFAIIFNIAWGMCIWSYFAAHATNPGVIPKRWKEFVGTVGDALPIANAKLEWQPGKATYCRRCDIPRPERAHHCVVCEYCVLRMDHHCPWINNCVGFNNHKMFLLLGIYASMASLLALGTALPELLGVLGAVTHITSDFPWADGFVKNDGFISDSGGTLLEETTTVKEAKRTCVALLKCIGFTFKGNTTNNSSALRTYFKATWDLSHPGSGWTSYRLEQVTKPDLTDIVFFLIFGILALLVAILLITMLATHLPLATLNITSIEDNYQNMPNPFDQGSPTKNLAQIFGEFGSDWFLPVVPWKPLGDGVSFTRSGEEQLLGTDIWDDEAEDLWRVRYNVRTTRIGDRIRASRQDGCSLSSIARWWSGV